MLISPSRLILVAAFTCAFAGNALQAQTIQPVIAEYVDHASGSFAVTNDSAYPTVVVLEPRSFAISIDGTGLFRTLDPYIHLQLSITSLRLEGHQTAQVFYKIKADHVPAWLCIYATFTSARKNPGLNVRMMLPHTIYLYQREPLTREAVTVSHVQFDAKNHKVTAEVTNQTDLAGRVQSVEVTGMHASTTGGGFPMLPHETRLLSLDWTSDQAPQDVVLYFPHFSLKRPVTTAAE